MPAPAPTTPARPTSRLRRWFLALAGVVLLIVLGASVFVWLLRGRPAWYAPPDPAAVTAQSETLENAVATQLTLPRRENAGEWSVSLTQEDANAWLAARFKRWCDSRGIEWPAGVSGVQAHFDQGMCTVGALVNVGGADRFVAIDVQPRIAEDGALFLTAKGGRIGRLGVPMDAAMRALGRVGSGEKLRAILTGEKAAMTQPRIKLEDGRLVRLLGIAFPGDRVEVRCRTELQP